MNGPTPPDLDTSRRRGGAEALLAAALVLGTILLFARAASFPFIYFDDNRYVTENPVVQRGLTWSGVVWAFTTLHVCNWHPLTWLSHMLDVELFGLDPGRAPPRERRAPRRERGAPLRLPRAHDRRALAERVRGRRSSRSTRSTSSRWRGSRSGRTCSARSSGCSRSLAYARMRRGRRLAAYLAVALLFALSLLAKPMWVTLPFAAAARSTSGRCSAWAGSPSRRSASRPPCPARPLGARSSREAAAPRALRRVLARDGRRPGARRRDDDRSTWRSATASGTRRRLRRATSGRPSGRPTSRSTTRTRRRAAGWQAAGAAARSLLARRRSPPCARAARRPGSRVGWFWFLGTLVPVIGLVQVGAQAMADRYTYLPRSASSSRSPGARSGSLWSRRRGRGRRASPRLAGALAGDLEPARLLVDHETLFRRALAVDPDSAVAHGVLSEGLRADGQHEEALAHAREAVRLNPTTVSTGTTSASSCANQDCSTGRVRWSCARGPSIRSTHRHG